MKKIVADLNNIIEFLCLIDSAAYFEHISYLNSIKDLIIRNNISDIKSKINSAELWGGSGSLLDSEFGMNQIHRNQFESLLIQLLINMKSEGIIEKRALSALKQLQKG